MAQNPPGGDDRRSGLMVPNEIEFVSALENPSQVPNEIEAALNPNPMAENLPGGDDRRSGLTFPNEIEFVSGLENPSHVPTEVEVASAFENPSQVTLMPVPYPQTQVEESMRNKLSRKIHPYLPWLLAILGGLSIGHALAVLGGVIGMDRFLKDYDITVLRDRLYTPTNNFCFYTHRQLLWLASIIPLMASGSIWISYLINTLVHHKFIFRKVILGLGICVLITGLSLVIWSGRFTMGLAFIGLSVGILRQVISVLSAELVPSSKRKLMGRVNSYCIVAGGTLAYFSNYMASPLQEWWQPFVVLFALSLSMLCISTLIQEPPQSYLLKGRVSKGLELLQKYRSDIDVDGEFSFELNQLEINSRKGLWRTILRGSNRPLLLINTLAIMLSQLSGVGSIVFFMPLLLESLIEITKSQSYTAPLFYSAVLLFAVVMYSETCYRCWRQKKWVMIVSLFMMSIAKIGLYILFRGEVKDHHLEGRKKYIGLFLAALTIPGYSSLVSPLGWATISYTPDVAVLGGVLANSFSMFITPVTYLLFVKILCALLEKAFLVFGVFAMLTAVAIGLLVPNTLDGDDRELNKVAFKEHYFWKRISLED